MTAPTKNVTDLPAFAGAVARADKLIVVDISDTTEGPEGTTKIGTAETVATVFAPELSAAAASATAASGSATIATEKANEASDILSTAAQIVTGNSIFLLNPTSVTQDTVLPSGFNAVSAGPIMISEGITVTISDHTTWSIT